MTDRPSSSKKRKIDGGFRGNSSVPDTGEPVSLFGEMPIPSSARSHGRPKQAGGTVYSCLPCRKRKTKCDKLQPCTRCVERKESSQCIPIKRDEEPKLTGYVQISDYNALFNRVSQIDLALSRVISQTSSPSAYSDIIANHSGPLPTLRRSESAGSKREGGDGEVDIGSGRSGSEDGEGDDDDERERGQGTGASGGKNSAMRARNPGKRGSSQSETIKQWGLHILSQATLSQPPPTPLNPISSLPNGNAIASSSHSYLNHQQQQQQQQQQHQNQTYSPQTYTQAGSVDAGNVDMDLATPTPRERGPDTRLGNEGLDGEFSAALHLEDLLLGRSGNFPRTLPDDQTSAFVQHAESQEAQMAGVPAKREPVKLNLPDPRLAKIVMGFYLDDVLYLDRLFHRPTFEASCQQLWNRSPDLPITIEDAAFISLYMACLIVGLWSMGARTLRTRLGLGLEDADKLVSLWQRLFASAQERSDWMQVHSIYPVQALIVIYPYMISVGRSEHYWALTGAAIRVAQSLRLHDIPIESEVVLPVAGRWKSAIDREIGRRVWRCLVEIDNVSITERGYEPTIPSRLRERCMPLHLNDADLHPDGLAVARPINEHTDTSFVLCRYDVLKALAVCLYKSHAERSNYAVILEAHRNILQLKQDLPPFYANLDIARRLLPESRSRLVVKEALSVQTILAIDMLTIHRPFFPSSFRDPKYLTSYQSTTQAAFDIINLLTKANELDDGAMYFAPRTCAVFAATVTLILDFCHTLDRGRAEVVEKGIRQGITLLQHARPRGNLGKGADVCAALLGKELERRALRPAATDTVPNAAQQQQGQADAPFFAEPWLLDDNAFAEMMTYFAPDGSLMDMWAQGGRPM